MGTKGAFFLGVFGVCSLLALRDPFYGIVGYVIHYHTFPENAWWGRGLASMGVRYSLTISMFLVVGTLMNLGKLPYRILVSRHEAIYLAYIGWMALTRMAAGQQVEHDYFDKMLKMSIFIMALTHVVVTPRRFVQFQWLMVVCGLYLGYEARGVPRSNYFKGRLNGGVGGPDFSDSNALAAHVLFLSSFIAVQYLRSGWKGKLVCLASGAFAANTVLLTQSRAAFLAILAGGVFAVVSVPKQGLKSILPLAAFIALGAVVMVDDKFMNRMQTISSDESEMDSSAQDRVASWRAGLRMFWDHPILGVGVGNFGAHMGAYLDNHAGRDTHNAYVRCAAELGLPGILLFSALIVNAFGILRRIAREHADGDVGDSLLWSIFGLRLALIMYLIESIFGSFNYTEAFAWAVMLPAALERVALNAEIDKNDHTGDAPVGRTA